MSIPRALSLQRRIRRLLAGLCRLRGHGGSLRSKLRGRGLRQGLSPGTAVPGLIARRHLHRCPAVIREIHLRPGVGLAVHHLRLPAAVLLLPKSVRRHHVAGPVPGGQPGHPVQQHRGGGKMCTKSLPALKKEILRKVLPPGKRLQVCAVAAAVPQLLLHRRDQLLPGQSLAPELLGVLHQPFHPFRRDAPVVVRDVRLIFLQKLPVLRSQIRRDVIGIIGVFRQHPLGGGLLPRAQGPAVPRLGELIRQLSLIGQIAVVPFHLRVIQGKLRAEALQDSRPLQVSRQSPPVHVLNLQTRIYPGLLPLPYCPVEIILGDLSPALTGVQLSRVAPQVNTPLRLPVRAHGQRPLILKIRRSIAQGSVRKIMGPQGLQKIKFTQPVLPEPFLEASLQGFHRVVVGQKPGLHQRPKYPLAQSQHQSQGRQGQKSGPPLDPPSGQFPPVKEHRAAIDRSHHQEKRNLRGNLPDPQSAAD